MVEERVARAERYPRVGADELDEAGRALRSSIVDGPRSSAPGQPRIEASDGTLNGPFGAFLFSPSVGSPLQALGAALRTQTSLSVRERELATIAVAAALGSRYELDTHTALARAAGIDDSDIRSAAVGDPLVDPREHAIVRFARANAREAAPREQFDGLARRVDRQGVFETIALVAYYRGLASMLDLLEISTTGDTTIVDDASADPVARERIEAYDLALLREEREITRVLISLGKCVDEYDFEGLARLYAEDGELITPWGGHRGRAGLAEYVQKDLGGYTALHHVSAGHLIDVVPGARRAKARMTLLASHVVDDSGTQFNTAGGHYDIDLVRERGRWHLATVRIVPAWFFDTQGHADRTAP